MKRRFTAATALAVLLACALAGAALAEAEPRDTLETEVSIGFTGAVYFVDMGSEGMDIDFGTHMMPPRGDTVFLPASDGSHTLRVCDRRATPGKWYVNGGISILASGSDSFTSYLRFYNPTATTGITLNLLGTAPDQNVLVNAPTEYKIMEAASGIIPGEYDMTATAENTRLQIPAAEVAKLKALEYSATVTWTLTLTP